MSNARVYVEGASRSVDDLARTYEKMENVPAWNREAVAVERPATDPLGLNARRSKKANKDPFFEGKDAAVRMTQFVALCASELELEPEQTLFAVELTALNTLNAKDCPVKAARIDAIREAAFQYYSMALAKIPDPK